MNLTINSNGASDEKNIEKQTLFRYRGHEILVFSNKDVVLIWDK